MLTIFGRRNSSNVQKVMWAVGEIGLEHRRIDLGGAFGGLDSPEFLARNPHGRVPVIDDGGTIVWESNAIVRYLCGRYSAGELWPEEPAARAAADQWMDWTLATLQPDLGGFFWGWYRTPPERRDAAANAALLARANQDLGKLDQLLASRPYLAADHLTMADIAAGVLLFRYFEMEIDRPRLPAVEAWYRRLRARRAFREHVMIPFEDLRGRLAF